MSDLGTLVLLKRCDWYNRFQGFKAQSKFKLLVIGVASVLFWFGLYQFFARGLTFFRGLIGDEYFGELVSSVLYVFFLAMSLMLLISNAIICYSSFFKSRETAFLLNSPMRVENVFLYKYIESLGFSSWAMLFLATPLMVAYGRTFDLPFQFYILSFAFFGAYIFIPASLGALISLVLTNFLPNLRRKLIPILALAAIVFLGVVVLKLMEFKNRTAPELRLVVEVFEGVEFTKNPLLPSSWITRGIVLLGQGDVRHWDALFFFGVIVANGAFLLTGTYSLSRYLMFQGWFKVQGQRRAKKHGRRRILDWIVHHCLFFLTQEIRLIVIKDIKSFIRDAVQWSQFLVFFGLLGIYFLNLRTFGYENRDLFWKMLISQMNLLATALTLSTFASRFIYPQLSLEGRRYWIIGMVPMSRDTILFGKLAVAFVSSTLISEVLIGISSVMLSMPAIFSLVHAVSMLGICLGLSGMAVGLGALYPNFREDNPSKIISGFGGTLNLVLNLLFVVACVSIQVVPFFMMYGRRQLGMDQFRLYLTLSMMGLALLSLAACILPMWLGLRAIRKLEI
jgi:ABC-2 type transport system permease protein